MRTDFLENSIDYEEEYNLNKKLELENIGREFKDLPPLYHYTSYSTLKKIIENGKWRFSNINGTNDLSEHLNLYVIYMLNRPNLFNYIPNTVKQSVIQNIQTQDYYNAKDYFIACFSDKKDDLGQWRIKYGDFGKGVCLEIDPKFFSDKEYVLNTDNLGWAKITYNADEHLKISKRILSEYEEPDPECDIDNTADLAWRFRERALTMKHPAFEIEHEYRLIAGAVDGNFGEAEFIAEDMTKNYVDYDLNSRFEKYKQPLFKSILLGKECKNNVKDVENLFKHNGLVSPSISIDVSDIPYRFSDDCKRRKR